MARNDARNYNVKQLCHNRAIIAILRYITYFSALKFNNIKFKVRWCIETRRTQRTHTYTHTGGESA